MKNMLCFGDSNTWGYNPATKDRYPKEIRWTGLLQEKLQDADVRIMEQGLCGRTTVFEDEYRPDRKGVDTLEEIFKSNEKIDSAVLMLGTNDCKTYYGNSAAEIAEGISSCLDVILQHVISEKVLLVSPICLGEDVWKDEFDPEFNSTSVKVSRELKDAYRSIAEEKNVRFIDASEYAYPSKDDQEHMDVLGHSNLANAIYESVKENIYL